MVYGSYLTHAIITKRHQLKVWLLCVIAIHWYNKSILPPLFRKIS